MVTEYFLSIETSTRIYIIATKCKPNYTSSAVTDTIVGEPLEYIRVACRKEL